MSIMSRRATPLKLMNVSTQAAPAATPAADLSQPREYTPPPIPQPLPKPGGPITPVVGPAPKQSSSGTSTESPSSSSAASPVAAGTAQATPGDSGVQSNVNPGGPPQPQASPQASPAAPPPSATVTMTPDFRFDPAQVTIQRGQTVKWVNQGRAPQTVTADPVRAKDKSHAAMPGGAQPFNSGVVNAGGSFSYTFDVAGSYAYFSIPQEQNGMLGSVTVQ